MPDLTYSTATATQIAEMITGNSVTIDSATLLGNAAQTATYANGDAVSPEMTPGDTGVIFSTGTATDATNAGTDFNTQNNTSTNFGGAGDSDLNAVASGTTQDAAGIEFTFEVPADAETGRISFSFASEEFLEYVGGGFSDLAAIYVDGVLVPLMGTTDGFIDVDNGAVNPNYIDNPVAADNINSEFDGIVTNLIADFALTPGATTTIKIVIADVGDTVYDSSIFLADGAILIPGPDGIVDGTDASETMDIGYVDNETDEIDGSDGDNDIIHGNGGDDIITGGAGDDLIYGDAGPTSARESFNWSDAPDPDNGSAIDDGDAISDGYAQDTGNVTVTLTAPNNPNITSEFETDPQFSDGIDTDLEAFDVNSSLRANVENGETGNYALDFSAEVTDVEFRINDIDDDTDSSIYIRAYDADGNSVVVDLSGGSNVTLLDNDGVVGNDTAYSADSKSAYEEDDEEASVLVQIAGPVSRIEIIITNPSGVDQDYTITDVFFDAVVAPDWMVGGDDTFVINDGWGADTFFGGESKENDGGDTIDASGVTADLEVMLSGVDAEGDAGTLTDGSNTVTFDEIENLILGSGDDEFTGAGGDDNVQGGAGDDILDGQEGSDILSGGADDDVFLASLGGDTMDGGTGHDKYNSENTAALLNNAITVDVDDNGDGTVQKSIDGTTDQVTSVEEYIADENVGITDEITLTDLVSDRANITGLDDNSVGSFTPDGGGAPILFGGGGGQPLLSELLGLYNSGSFSITSGDETGQVGNISFENFETINFSVACFCEGTMIETSQGQLPIEDLRPGHMVKTVDRRFQPVRWIGSSHMETTEKTMPIRFKKGVLGNFCDLRVSPQHRIMLSAWQADMLYGEREVLVTAKSLVNDDTIVVDEVENVSYYHMLFDTHEVIYSNGATTESFHPGIEGMLGFDDETREEVYSLFPQLEDDFASYGPSARLSLKTHEAKFVRNIFN